MKRPLGWVATLFGGGIVLGNMIHPPWFVLYAVALLASLFCFFASARLRPILLGLLVFVAGWFDLVCHTATLSPYDLRHLLRDEPALATIRGALLNTPQSRLFVQQQRQSWRTQATLCLEAIRRQEDWEPAHGRVVVSTRGLLPEGFYSGQAVEINGVLAPPRGPVAEGLFDYRAYLERQEIYYLLNAESSNDWRRIGIPVSNHPPASDRFLAWAHRALALGLPAEDEALRLEWALSLGDKSVLTEETSEPFIRAATYHIFAVDGLRMAILFGIFYTLLRAVRVPRTIGGLALIPLIWFYTALTGWPASAIRASTMLTLVVAGWILKRPGDLLNSLFAAALIILLCDPQQLFQAGFQLSFTVVFCMILTLPVFDRWSTRLVEGDPLVLPERRPWWRRRSTKPVRYVLDLLLTSFAAWLGSIPLVAYYFHILTPVSTPANLVAVPLCSLVLASNFASLLTAPWFPAIAVLFNHAGWFLMECIRVTSIWFADWPRAYWYVAAPGGFTIGCYYALLAAIFTGWLLAPARRVWKLSALISMSCLWVWLAWRQASATRLYVLPLQGGSAIYFDAPGSGEDLLIDCGNLRAVDGVLKPFLRARGVNGLPCLALTHGDARQTGGAERLSQVMPLDHVAASPAPFRSPAYRNFLKSQSRNAGGRLVIGRNGTLRGWSVLHPDAEDRFALGDDAALVFWRELGGIRILLLSDLGGTGQDTLLERMPDLRADVVIGGLPDSSEPLSDALLDQIQPRLVILTDSEFAATRRAKTALRERLSRRHCQTVYLADVGAITLSLESGRWQIQCLRKQLETEAGKHGLDNIEPRTSNAEH